MSDITIYGASDDLVEVEGAVREEYEHGNPCSRLRLVRELHHPVECHNKTYSDIPLEEQ